MYRQLEEHMQLATEEAENDRASNLFKYRIEEHMLAKQSLKVGDESSMYRRVDRMLRKKKTEQFGTPI